MAALRHALTRRRLLKAGGLLGGAAVVLAGGAAWVLWPRPTMAGLRALSEGEAAVVRAMADAWLPAGNAFGVAASEVDIVGGVDGYVAALPAKQGKLLRGLIAALDLWPRLSFVSSARFVDLAPPARREVLRAFEDSALAERRQLAGLLRLLVAIPYFDDERVRADPDLQWGCPVIPS